MDTTGQQSPSLRTAYRDLLDEMVNWRDERKAENVKFYAGNIQRVTITPRRERTTRKSTCDVCLTQQRPGIRSFFMTGTGGHRFQACESCWNEIMQAAPMSILLAAQVA